MLRQSLAAQSTAQSTAHASQYMLGSRSPTNMAHHPGDPRKPPSPTKADEQGTYGGGGSTSIAMLQSSCTEAAQQRRVHRKA